MLLNYLQTMIRSLVRNKLFSSLNLLGLSLGISSSLLILLWVYDERSIDSFHDEQLYRVLENQRFTDGFISTTPSTPGPLAPALKEKYPEVKYASRYFSLGEQLVQLGDKNFLEQGKMVDVDFLKMFNFPMLTGDVHTALVQPQNIVLTEALAQKLFLNEDPIGKTIKINKQDDYQVVGILKDIPKNSSLQFSFLISIEPFSNKPETDWFRQWGNHNTRTFITLHDQANLNETKNRLLREHAARVPNSGVEFIIQPFHESYLYSVFKNGKLTDNGRIEYVRIFTLIAVFVLFIACINFMNLSTAQSVKRSKEVGIRKVVGAFRKQLIGQFLGESIFFVVLASVLGILMVFLILPMFNIITEKQISFSVLNANILFMVAMLILTAGLIAGSYPAIYMSAFRPVTVLKGFFKTGKSAHVFRRALVVLQFTLSIAMIICTIVITRQMIFIQNRDVGFERNGLLYMPLQGEMAKHSENIKQELLKQPDIESVAVSSISPLKINNFSWGVEWEGKTPDQEIRFMTMQADADFARTLKMELISGRTFYENIGADSFNIMINEAAVKVMGYDDAIDKRVKWWGNRDGKIIGVVKDFNFESTHEVVQPMLILPPQKNLNPLNTLIVRVSNIHQYPEAIRALEQLHTKFSPEYPFDYKLVEDDWNNLHKSENKVMSLFIYFATLSIAISCLGLFGLAAFSAEQRRKEIGVRKVLGASFGQLAFLMTKDFTKLILWGALPGCLLGWYYLQGWLSDFAYRIEIGYVTPIIAIGIAFTIAIITVSYHAIKASKDNPVVSLRQE